MKTKKCINVIYNFRCVSKATYLTGVDEVCSTSCDIIECNISWILLGFSFWLSLFNLLNLFLTVHLCRFKSTIQENILCAGFEKYALSLFNKFHATVFKAALLNW